MAEVVKMPKLSDTMTEGVVATWNKKVGDTVKRGDILAEIESDKATMEFESFYNGTLLYIGVEKGQAAPVDAILCIIGKPDEDVKAIIAAASEKKAETEKKEEKKAEPVAEQKTVAPVAEKKQEAAKPVAKPVTVAVEENGDGRIKASPLAKKLAAEKGLDLHGVSGTGEYGRVVKRDVESWHPGKTGMISFGMGAGVVNGKESYTEEPVSQMRKTIARRLAESKFSAPHFYLTMEIDMEQAVKSREAINAISPVKISFNDMVIRACATALRYNPKVNSSWLGDKIRYNHHVHIGVAVAVEEGLLVPVVRFADQKSFAQIGAEVKEFAKKAKEKKLQPSDWEGNTFTISNLGMFGIEEFTAIINPPDSCILAVGGIKDVPVVKNGQVVPGKIMKVTLSCDHRVVDGATGSAFLQSLKMMLENPVTILM
ncbi:MAG TPA: pyruvate dehydrogenase complex dihydrolipoamide acetyltransferase [Bacteroidia bacterium]|nr:pyruvate dehydrogenase complex dihydrolipoamide acetyltransferase [Bacteroidia bacterium]